MGTHLVDIANQFGVAAYGPIGCFSYTTDNDSSPNFTTLTAGHRRLQRPATTPLLIANLDSDDEAHRTVQTLNLDPNTPIIWQNLNNGSPDRLNNFLKNILPSDSRYMFSVNGKCFEYKFAKHVNTALRSRQIIDQLVLGTDSPHYPATYCNKPTSHPLQIANMILELHLILTKSEHFKHFSLADTNDLLTSNAFSIFPRRLFDDLNRRSFESYVRNKLSHTLTEYRPQIKYLQNLDNRTVAAKRPAQETEPVAAPVPKKQRPIPKPSSPSSPPALVIDDTNLDSNTTLPDLSLTLDTTLPDLSHAVNELLPVINFYTNPAPPPALTGASLSQPVLSERTNKPALAQRPKPKKPTIPPKPKETVATRPSTSTASSTVAPKKNAENAAAERARRIIDRAHELHFAKYPAPWSESSSGSKIQIQKVPKDLVRKMATEAENLTDAEFEQFLTNYKL
jgi:hypothetical protein